MAIYKDVSSSGTGTPGPLRNVYLVDATSAAITRTLPDATVSRGQITTISKVDASANAVTVNTTASQTVVGTGGAVTSLSLTARGNSVTAACDGSTWHVIAKI